MKACVLQSSEKTLVLDVSLPEIKDDEVLIKVSVCGICTSELSSWHNGQGGINGVLGHEAVGTVEKVGKGVSGFKTGDRVTGLMQGAYAEYTVANYMKIIHVPDAVSDKEALGEPLSCILSGVNRTPVKLGDTVAIIGLGYMGLLFMQAMKRMGAGKIIAIDIRQASLDTALKYGADEVYLPDNTPDKYKLTEWSHLDTERGCDVVVETSGTQAGIDLAGDMVNAHGILSIVGWHQYGLRSIDLCLWNWKGIDVINAHERRSDVHIECMKQGMRLIERDLIDTKNLVTHVFSLSELDDAFKLMVNKPDGYIKAVIEI